MCSCPRVELRYFDCRGRAQFLRNFLASRGIPHEEHRVPLSADLGAWTAMRDDRTLCGPFHKLPVLHWGEQTISEALVIASFLHRAVGDQERLSEEDNLRHDMLVSSVYVDLMHPIGVLLWAELAFAGVDIAALARQTLKRVGSHLAALDRTLEEWRWLEQAAGRPVTLADCLLWEELDVAQCAFGDRLRLDQTPTLERFYRECPGHAQFADLLRQRPCQVTGRPGEAEAIGRIRQALASD